MLRGCSVGIVLSGFVIWVVWADGNLSISFLTVLFSKKYLRFLSFVGSYLGSDALYDRRSNSLDFGCSVFLKGYGWGDVLPI